MHAILQQWNEKYFYNQLSPDVLRILDHLDFNNHEITNFLDIHFNYLHLSGFNPKNFTPQWAQWFVDYLESYLLSAWQRVPPITARNRLHHFDDVLTKELKLNADQSLDILDIGCGYPPETTLDLAEHFPKWNITAIDPGMPEYILYDEEGHAACYDKNKQLIYIQRNPKVRIFQFSPTERAAMIAKFDRIWQPIKDKPINDPQIQALIKEQRFIYQPLKHYQTAKLKFFVTTIQDMTFKNQFDVARCFAVFNYLSNDEIKKGLSKVKNALHDNAYFIYGKTQEVGTAPVYVIYRKENGFLTPLQFAFSIDHLSQMTTSFWAFYNNHADKLLLAKLLNVINQNNCLMGYIEEYIDDFYFQHNLAHRDQHGYLIARNRLIAEEEFAQLNSLLKKRFMVDVLRTLQRAGFDAFENRAGDVAVSLRGIAKDYGFVTM